MDRLEKNSDYTDQTFEDIKHIDENGNEFWYARELMKILEYKQWRRFENVIYKAKQACENSDISVFEHFADVGKLSKRANNAEVQINWNYDEECSKILAEFFNSKRKIK